MAEMPACGRFNYPKGAASVATGKSFIHSLSEQIFTPDADHGVRAGAGKGGPGQGTSSGWSNLLAWHSRGGDTWP